MAADMLIPLILPSDDQPESVQAKPIGEGRVIIVDVPSFSDVYGFADVVATESRDGALYAGDIIDKGSWATYGVFFETADAVKITERLKVVEREGCIIHLRSENYASIGVPSEDVERISKLLDSESAGVWRVAQMLAR